MMLSAFEAKLNENNFPDIETKVASSLSGSMSALEAKMINAVGAKFAEDKLKERIEAIEQAVKAQQQLSEQHQA